MLLSYSWNMPTKFLRVYSQIDYQDRVTDSGK